MPYAPYPERSPFEETLSGTLNRPQKPPTGLAVLVLLEVQV